jgi:hypothetical protein
MMKLNQYITTIIGLVFLLLLSACSATEELAAVEDMEPAAISAEELLVMIPDYRDDLVSLRGSGRAIVSEPGNSDRVTLNFKSNRTESLINVRTSVGVEGGQIFVDRDSLLIYNRVDKVAEKVPLHQGRLSSVGSIASVNMLDLFNFTLDEGEVAAIYEDRNSYVAVLENRATIKIEKNSGLIQEVVHASTNHEAPYSRIEYEGYAEIENFQLPRRITIVSSDGRSRATLLVQRLEINVTLPELGIDIPDDVPIYRL